MIRNILLLALVLNGLVRTAEADWPQFRGPNASGVAVGKAPPIEFGPENNVRWRLPLQSGHSSPVVSGDAVFVTTYDAETKQLRVVCIDREQGSIRWERPVKANEIEQGHPSFNPASSTPVTDGERVVAYFGSYGLVCFDWQGNQQWQFPLPLTKSYSGNAISPIIAGDQVILYRGNYVDHFLLSVDKKTGKERWRSPQVEPFRPELACSAIPVVAGDLLVLHGARSVQGFDLQTGEQRWVTKCATTATSSPLIVNERVIVAAWNKMGEPALRPEFPSFENLIAKQDRDKDGVIQQLEFPELWIFHRPEGIEAPQNGAKIRFKSVDQDKNGEISKTEWEQQLRNLDRFRQGYQNHGLLSIPITGSGILSDNEVITLETQGIPEVPSPISDGRFVYLVKNGGQVTCIDLQTGQRIYRKRTGGRGTHYASPIIAGNNLYIADGSGRIAVMTLGEAPQILARNEMLEGVYATPAASGGILYVRTHSMLYAFEQAEQ
ncbi:MAG: PQQ-binding-like beta-propeller repeat protein [Rubripirellula sp.]|nr:PQQ-binding-like beta-propeller repeat protein [Rubripirellula sp.]